jgi:drug/metabolite transporter (DMT)-like permease
MGGLRTISWTLVLGAPLTWGATAWLVARDGFPQASAPAWAGFAYLSVVSMFLGFVPWYHGLAKGGVARVSQTQLLQPLLTVGWAALLLGEAFHARTLAAAVVVLASAAYTLSQRAPVVEPHVSARERKIGEDAAREPSPTDTKRHTEIEHAAEVVIC